MLILRDLATRRRRGLGFAVPGFAVDDEAAFGAEVVPGGGSVWGRRRRWGGRRVIDFWKLPSRRPSFRRASKASGRGRRSQRCSAGVGGFALVVGAGVCEAARPGRSDQQRYCTRRVMGVKGKN